MPLRIINRIRAVCLLAIGTFLFMALLFVGLTEYAEWRTAGYYAPELPEYSQVEGC